MAVSPCFQRFGSYANCSADSKQFESKVATFHKIKAKTLAKVGSGHVSQSLQSIPSAMNNEAVPD